MKKTYIFILLLFVVLSFASCNENDKSVISTIKYISSVEYWEYECLPEGYVSLVEKEQTFSSKIRSIIYAAYSGTGRSYYYKFKAEKPGEFTLCWISYDPLSWIDEYNSYVVDYVINENLEIEQVGEQRPIYEIEKYDKLLFEQYVNQIKRNFDRSFEREKLAGIKYLITSDYQTKTIFLSIQNNNYDEGKLIEFTENEMDFYLNNFGAVSAQYNYSIIFE